MKSSRTRDIVITLRLASKSTIARRASGRRKADGGSCGPLDDEEDDKGRVSRNDYNVDNIVIIKDSDVVENRRKISRGIKRSRLVDGEREERRHSDREWPIKKVKIEAVVESDQICFLFYLFYWNHQRYDHRRRRHNHHHLCAERHNTETPTVRLAPHARQSNPFNHKKSQLFVDKLHNLYNWKASGTLSVHCWVRALLPSQYRSWP